MSSACCHVEIFCNYLKTLIAMRWYTTLHRRSCEYTFFLPGSADIYIYIPNAHKTSLNVQPDCNLPTRVYSPVCSARGSTRNSVHVRSADSWIFRTQPKSAVNNTFCSLLKLTFKTCSCWFGRSEVYCST